MMQRGALLLRKPIAIRGRPINFCRRRLPADLLLPRPFHRIAACLCSLCAAPSPIHLQVLLLIISYETITESFLSEELRKLTLSNEVRNTVLIRVPAS
jgi:hypothetical protein